MEKKKKKKEGTPMVWLEITWVHCATVLYLQKFVHPSLNYETLHTTQKQILQNAMASPWLVVT